MKKIYFLLAAALLFSCTVLANNVIIKGYIKDNNGTPVPNQGVSIYTDSLTTPNGCHQYAYVYTNANGFYADTLSCPGGDLLNFIINTQGCNGQSLTENVHLTAPATVVERNFTLACNIQQTCTASFTFYLTGGPAVYFFSNSGGSSGINTYVWHFGDGTTSNLSSPMHTYAATGTYAVKLIISTANGCIDSVTQNITITNTLACHAAFTDSMLTPNKFIFNSQASVTTTGSNITQRIWSFGDGTGNSGNNAVVDHIYQQSGTYNVCLKIVSSQGCVDSVCKQITVTVPTLVCTASFTFQPIASTAGFNMQFNSSASGGSSANDAIVSRLWIFGDGQTLTGNQVSPTHYYPAPGNYQVCLKITTASGCQKTECKTITLADSSCHAGFNFGVSQNLATFNSTSTASPNSNIVTHFWSFGDGTSAYTQQAITHAYSAPGTYNVKLIIQSSSGCKDSVNHPVTISYTGATCHAAMTDSMITNNKFIFRSSNSIAASGDSIVHRIWSFGDGTGNSGNNAIVDHIYQQSGTYTVCLKIISAQGCTDSVCKQVTVIIPPAVCTANFTSQRIASTAGFNMQFNSSTSGGTSPNDAIVSRLWNFGDGQTLSGNQVSPTHYYPAPGNYQVCLKITTASGCTKTECKTISLFDSTCHANFTYTLGSGGVVAFTNTSNTLGTSAQYVWSFGNLATGAAVNPVFTFPPGTYNVCLRVYSNNCMDSVCKTIVVPNTPANCEAVFQYTGLPPATTPGYKLQFNSGQSHATSAATDSIHERIWNWGDGTSTGGNSISPLHTFNTAGVYNVCLIIRTTSGCSDTTCKSITVPMPNQLTCQSKFTWEYLPTTTVAGKSIRFNSSTAVAGAGDSIIIRKWNFGDGSPVLSGNIVSPVHVYMQPGSYNVCLTITTALGCTKTECKLVVVPQLAGNCVPHFTWTKTAPKQIAFNSSSSWVPANDSIIERKWQFGDASPLLAGNVIAPVHNYPFNGIYTVTLKIRTAHNCEKTFYGVVPVQDSINTNTPPERIKIISLYPTPATYQVQAVVWSLQNNIQAELAIYDIYGTKKWSINKVLSPGNNVTVIPTGFLAPGPYYLRVTTMFGVKTRPFFKQ